MTNRYSIAEARDNLARIVHNVEQGTSVQLTRRGKPVAVLMSIAEYRKLADGEPGFWAKCCAFRDRVSIEKLDVAPEAFADVRDRSSGREVAW